ncbi:integral peroxisomal membrane peroxin-domain-containing protein [Mycena rosella]|uniref:Integral peroxisomal membrane peroxin-domain-containing protein n=1 Tax=Mycena rosella TaxID=1033263 RepID=A0AAD7GII9_MYCRO|nr:integral peroxisomal membrane peroxin-domain-containing protein [Mycena rosella]
MASLDYIDVPAVATRLRPQSPDDGHQIRRAPKIVTSLPHPRPPPMHRRTDSAASISSPAKTAVNLLPQLLLSSLPSNAPPQGPSNPRGKQQANTLLSSRDPLSVPILTVNFKRFIERVGPIFWLQDRIEEIIFWRRGWKVTGVWIAAYAFLCYFPRLLFLLPQLILIGIILATHPETTHKPPPAPEAPAESGSVDWQANIQAIQNLMGLVADGEAALQPYIPYLTHRKPHTPHILTLLIISLFPMLALVSLPAFPVRGVCLFLGIAPLLFTHPNIRLLLPSLAGLAVSHADASPLLTKLRSKLFNGRSTSVPPSWKSLGVRLIDDANLTDECWVAQIREVQLFENERFGAAEDSTHQEWSKTNLRDGERTGWTRGRDGWSGIGSQGGVSSNLTFSLDVGWAFVDTEDWRADLGARWAADGGPRGGDDEAPAAVGDEDGWVYTNDAWIAHRPPSASYAPSVGGVTRRRRWVRRIWYDHTRAVSMS